MRGASLLKIAQFIKDKVDSRGGPSSLQPMAIRDLFRALIIEAAHSTHDIDPINRVEIFRLLVTQAKDMKVPLMRNWLATSLAVVVMATNKLPPLLVRANHRSAQKPYQGQIRARGMARRYTEREDWLVHDGDALLLLGLAGLLEVYESQGVETCDESIEAIAHQLRGLGLLDQHEPIHLSTTILPDQFDIRLYAVEVLARLFSDEPNLSGQYHLSKDHRAILLDALIDKSCIWSSWGDRLIPQVLHMIEHTEVDDLLRTKCLEAMQAYLLVMQSSSAPLSPRNTLKSEVEKFLRRYSDVAP
jgi:hypothetical protein